MTIIRAWLETIHLSKHILKKKLFFGLVGVAYFFFFIYVLLVSIPNPIQLRYSIFQKNLISWAIPEGWAFFTKDPQSENTVIYSISDSPSLDKIKLTNSQWKYFFGASRKSRYINAKLVIISSNIREENWVAIDDFSSITKQQVDSLRSTLFFVKPPFIYGEYIIRKYKPSPWSWFSFSGINDALPSKIAKVNIINSESN